MIIVCMDCNLDQRLTVLFDVPRLVAPPDDDDDDDDDFSSWNTTH